MHRTSVAASACPDRVRAVRTVGVAASAN